MDAEKLELDCCEPCWLEFAVVYQFFARRYIVCLLEPYVDLGKIEREYLILDETRENSTSNRDWRDYIPKRTR